MKKGSGDRPGTNLLLFPRQRRVGGDELQFDDEPVSQVSSDLGGKPVQMTMFDVAADQGVHRVAAHTRQLASGDEVFVGEHLRWSRGRQSKPKRPARGPACHEVGVQQVSLFGYEPEARNDQG